MIFIQHWKTQCGASYSKWRCFYQARYLTDSQIIQSLGSSYHINVKCEQHGSRWYFGIVLFLVLFHCKCNWLTVTFIEWLLCINSLVERSRKTTMVEHKILNRSTSSMILKQKNDFSVSFFIFVVTKVNT